MTKSIVAVLAVLLVTLVMAVPASAAPRGQRFYADSASPSQLADVFEAYLNRNPSGMSLIDAKRCATHGDASCATGQAFLEGILAGDPDAQVGGAYLSTVSQIPAFLRKLEVRDPAPGIYWSDCMIRTTDRERYPSGWKRLEHCARNEFKPGEKAYVDPDTGITVMKQGCANTGVQAVQPAMLQLPPSCGAIMVPVQAGDVVLMEGHGPTDSSKDVTCSGLLRPGETEYESPAVERCEHPYCEIDVEGTALRPNKQWEGSFEAEQSGWAILIVPLDETQEGSEYQDYFCIHRGDTTFYGLGVRWFDYLARQDSHVPPGVQSIAVIQPDYETALSQGRITRSMDHPSILWWDTDRSHYRE